MSCNKSDNKNIINYFLLNHLNKTSSYEQLPEFLQNYMKLNKKPTQFELSFSAFCTELYEKNLNYFKLYPQQIGECKNVTSQFYEIADNVMNSNMTNNTSKLLGRVMALFVHVGVISSYHILNENVIKLVDALQSYLQTNKFFK